MSIYLLKEAGALLMAGQSAGAFLDFPGDDASPPYIPSLPLLVAPRNSPPFTAPPPSMTMNPPGTPPPPSAYQRGPAYPGEASGLDDTGRLYSRLEDDMPGSEAGALLDSFFEYPEPGAMGSEDGARASSDRGDYIWGDAGAPPDLMFRTYAAPSGPAPNMGAPDAPPPNTPLVTAPFPPAPTVTPDLPPPAVYDPPVMSTGTPATAPAPPTTPWAAIAAGGAVLAILYFGRQKKRGR